jgi:hypothetical protein
LAGIDTPALAAAGEVELDQLAFAAGGVNRFAIGIR